MDIARPDLARKRRFRHGLYTVSGLVVVALITVGVSRLEPAAPRVDADTVFIDTVQRGPMVREVRGTGTLVPETIRWIPAVTDGTVERIVIRPGATIEPGTVILE
ncbi:MAG: RND transporter, partial [Acidobacteria bacterium]|nr:RND transporter [Acidobacteriota bacterium]MYD71500.1 RND transporter [Acidobacteriota bacterium]MYJ06067.1 RND transporter [Acidobacteriota bacterium]